MLFRSGLYGDGEDVIPAVGAYLDGGGHSRSERHRALLLGEVGIGFLVDPHLDQELGHLVGGKAGAAAEVAKEATPAIEAAVEVAPQLTKSQSQAAMKAKWEAGEGNTEKFSNWNHQWNVEEKPKFDANRPAPEQPVVKKQKEELSEPESYDRVTNEAGYYSHGAEVARAMKQQKGSPEQMISALKIGRAHV